ncbi:MAG TPA: proton-conducting transporter membrane subunit, partial [Pseudonocardiaceae bacterium]|nr:proton-conducting transporter membrane subunit [Pseudonocardiaceae bacterium]
MVDPSGFPAACVATPVLGACVLLAGGRWLPGWAVDAIGTATTLIGTGLAALLLHATAHGRVVEWAGGWQPRPGVTVGIVLVADRTGAGLTVLIFGLTTCALLFGWRYFDTVHAHYPALMLLFAAGMAGFALTGDLFDMFVFFELMGAAAYALAGFKIEEPDSVQGGLNFGVVNSLGAYLSLTGVGLLYARTGELGLPQLASALAGRSADPLVWASFALICTGWLVKAAIVPFHFWLADAHAVAPTPVCVLFSGVMAPLGVLTAVLGAIMCWTQRHIKRLLAYSTIAHVGLFVVAAATLTDEGTAGAALYVAGHAGV